MHRHRYSDFILLLFALAMLIAFALLASPAVRSQSVPLDDVLALARLSASETGLRTDVDDTAAIHEVIQFRARLQGVTYVQAARRYSRDAIVDGHASRPWIGQLAADGSRPLGWYAHLPWAGRNRRRWMRLYRKARLIHRGDIVSRCREAVHDWGADSISERYVSANADASRVECGHTLNVFWHLGRYAGS